jgi:WD40 repeat protein
MNTIEIQEAESSDSNEASFFQKHKILIIIGGITIAVVIITLAIVLPIVLTSSSSSPTSTPTTTTSTSTQTTTITPSTASTTTTITTTATSSSTATTTTNSVIPFGQVIQTLTGHTASVGKVVELPNDRLASISTDNTIRIWNRETSLGENTLNIDQRDYILNFASFQNGNLAAARQEFPYDIEIFSPNNDPLVLIQTLSGHSQPVNG